MPSAAHLRLQLETALAHRIPSALTPAPRVIRPTAPTGIAALDAALNGGLPLGAITELAGPECSGRTSLVLSFIAGLARAGHVCAWVDVSDALHPESAAAAGVDLARLLWIRCGPEAEQIPLPGFGDNPPPKIPEKSSAPESGEKKVPVSVTNSPAVQDFTARCAEPRPTIRKKSREAVPEMPSAGQALISVLCALRPDLQPVPCNLSPAPSPGPPTVAAKRPLAVRKPWSRLDQALRAADLLLNAGGFAAIVLDMGGVAPEFALRIPLATWFRYRAAAERSQASVLLLTQQACTKSSAGLVLHCEPGPVNLDSTTVFTGAESLVTIARERFANVSGFTRKPPQSDLSGAGASANRTERMPLSPSGFASAPSGFMSALSGFSNCVRWRTQTPWAATIPPHSPKAGRP